jgi:hypothetical protein
MCDHVMYALWSYGYYVRLTAYYQYVGMPMERCEAKVVDVP